MSMFIGQGLSLEACHATQAERWAANTATAATSEAAAAAANSMAAAAADSTAAAAALTKRASSASWPFFALSPPAKMDSIAPPLVYAEDFYLEHNRSVRAEHALPRSYQHERTRKTPPCAVSWRPQTQRPVQLLHKHPQSLLSGSNYLGGQDKEVQ
jgi:hypothetical protein